MTFEQQLLSLPCVKDIQESKLLKHALKASESPDTGITINVKSAYKVIGDCATIASLYIPLHVYSKIDSPIIKLQKSFTKTQVFDFVNRASQDAHTFQFLKCLLFDIDTFISNRPSNAPQIASYKSQKVIQSESPDDVYGDYDTIDSTKTYSTESQESIPDKIIRVLNITKQ